MAKRPGILFKPTLLCSAIVLASASLSIQAAPNPYNDARSSAMGFTGAASARSVGAVLKNPALLAAPHPEHLSGWGLTLPSVGANALADEELVDTADDFQGNNRWDDLERAIDELDTAANGGTEPEIRTALDEVASQARIVDRDLTKLDDSTLRGSGGGMIGFVMPSPKLAFGIYVTGYLDVFALGRYEDSEQVNELIDNANTLLDTDPTLVDINDFDLTVDPESEGEVIGMSVTEVGIPLAHEFQIGERFFQVGVTPKFQEIHSFLYIANIDGFEEDDFDTEDQETSTSGFNLDLGFSHQFGSDGQYTVGLMTRNLIKKELMSVEVTNAQGQTVSRMLTLEPQATLGIAYTGSSLTLAADLDLTENSASGFEPDRQYLAVGAEYDFAHWVQVRGGLRHNLASGSNLSSELESDTVATFGLGFSPGWFHIDLSGMAGSDEYGALLELGFQG